MRILAEQTVVIVNLSVLKAGDARRCYSIIDTDRRLRFHKMLAGGPLWKCSDDRYAGASVPAHTRDQDRSNHYHNRIAHPYSVRRQIPILGLFETEDEQGVVGQKGRKKTQAKG